MDIKKIIDIYSSFQKELYTYTKTYNNLSINNTKSYELEQVNMLKIFSLKTKQMYRGVEILLPQDGSQFNDVYRQLDIYIDANEPDKIGVKSKNNFIYTLFNSQIESLNESFNQIKSQKEYIVIEYASLLETVASKFISNILNDKNVDNILDDSRIKYKDIVDFNSLEELKEVLITRKVNDIMYKSFEEWANKVIKICSKKLLSDQNMNKYVDILNEMYSRRNLYVHNNGNVNSIYVNSLKDKKNNTHKLGDYLDIDRGYISSISKTIWYFITNIFFGILENELSDIKGIDVLLDEIGLESYRNREYKLGSYFFKKYGKLVKSLDLYKESDFDTYLITYNEMLGYVLDKNNDKERAITQFITYFKECEWWEQEPIEYTDFAINALTLDEKEFLKKSIEFSKSKLLNDKNSLANILTWPMFQRLDGEEDWDNFVDTVYKEGLKYTNS